jgi:hypothetical protein
MAVRMRILSFRVVEQYCSKLMTARLSKDGLTDVYGAT